MEVAKHLETHLECPICVTVPRDGVMLQCVNGHNVCAACKDKIGPDAKCPQGRCDFGVPPAINPTVASLVKSFFKWPCKYAKEAGCQFKGVSMGLESHERNCRKKFFPCPVHNCKEMVSFATVVQHCDTKHAIFPFRRNISSSNQGRMTFGWKDYYYHFHTSFNWRPQPFVLGCVKWGLLCCHKHEHHDQVFLWLWALLDEDEADKLECKFSLHQADGSTTVVVAPVYSLAWDRHKVMRDERCVRIPASQIDKMLTQENFPEEFKNDGYFEFRVSFEVSEKRRFTASATCDRSLSLARQ